MTCIDIKRVYKAIIKVEFWVMFWLEENMAKLKLVVACALIDDDNRILISKRPEGKPMANKWEFPGGAIEDGESPEGALLRELKEELDIDISAACLSPLSFASHEYAEFNLLMPLYICRNWAGIEKPLEGQELKWVKANKLREYDFLEADLPLLPVLRDLLIGL